MASRTTTLSGAAYAFVPMNSHIPDAKACVVSLFDYDANVTYILDLTSTVNTAQLKHGIQSIFMDGSQMPNGEFTVTIAGSNQSFTILGGQSAYFPVTIVGQNIFTLQILTNNSAYIINPRITVIFYTIPFVTHVWNGNAQSNRDSALGSVAMTFRASDGTSKSVTIAQYGDGVANAYMTGYTFNVLNYSVSSVLRAELFLTNNFGTIDSIGWVLGPYGETQIPMKNFGLNLLLNVPGGPTDLVCFVVLTQALGTNDYINFNGQVFGNVTTAL